MLWVLLRPFSILSQLILTTSQVPLNRLLRYILRSFYIKIYIKKLWYFLQNKLAHIIKFLLQLILSTLKRFFKKNKFNNIIQDFLTFYSISHHCKTTKTTTLNFSKILGKSIHFFKHIIRCILPTINKNYWHTHLNTKIFFITFLYWKYKQSKD